MRIYNSGMLINFFVLDMFCCEAVRIFDESFDLLQTYKYFELNSEVSMIKNENCFGYIYHYGTLCIGRVVKKMSIIMSIQVVPVK